MNNVKTTGATRPDKSMFFAMMGLFFILFSLPAFYWAFYSYGQYSKTTSFVQDLRKKTDTDFTPTARQERSERISVSNSRADRFLLEATISGAGGLILFGISLLFFRKAWQARKKKNIYNNIDTRTIPMPTTPIKVGYKRLYDVLFALIFLFFGGMLLLILYQNFTSKFISPTGAIIRSLLSAVPIFLLLSLICYLMIRAKRNAVQVFDVSGIKRGDGRQFSWNEFCGVVTQIDINFRTQRKYVWRVELAFENGESAWIIPNRIKNAEEVFNYVATLPRANLRSRT